MGGAIDTVGDLVYNKVLTQVIDIMQSKVAQQVLHHSGRKTWDQLAGTPEPDVCLGVWDHILWPVRDCVQRQVGQQVADQLIREVSTW